MKHGLDRQHVTKSIWQGGSQSRGAREGPERDLEIPALMTDRAPDMGLKPHALAFHVSSFDSFRESMSLQVVSARDSTCDIRHDEFCSNSKLHALPMSDAGTTCRFFQVSKRDPPFPEPARVSQL